MNFINPAYGGLLDLAKSYQETFMEAMPFPNIVFRNFFNENILNEVLSEFGDLSKIDSLYFKTPNEVKFASKGEAELGFLTKEFVHFLNSEPFLIFLSTLTGIEETLIPDPFLYGGGLHETKSGGFLKIHTDVNKHPLTKLDRRLNVIIYLNKDWRESYGGNLEFWDSDMQHCVKKITPEFNTMVIFTTTDYNYHGLPSPLQCPPDKSRKSISLYYYSNGRPSHEINDGLEGFGILFKARKGNPEDNLVTSYNQKQAVKSYIKELTPPSILDFAKKIIGKEE